MTTTTTTMGDQQQQTSSSLWKRKGSTSIVVLLWIVLASCPLFSRATAVPPKQPPSLVDDWIRAKGFGGGRRDNNSGQQQQLWMYQGALYDPLDGRKIANVQGLELVSTIRSRKSNNNNQTNIHSLKIQSLLQDPNATYEEAATLWSQNIFCYTTNNNKNKNSNHTLLREIRVRPQSPRKIIPLNQAVALYETATTLICRGDDDKDDDAAMIHSEFLVPKQKESSLWSPVTTRKHDDSTLEWTVYAKRRSPKSRLYLPDLLTTTTKKKRSNTNNSSSHEDDDSAIPIISPERSALIQFGSSNMESKHKFGARETYSWNLPKAAAQPEAVVKKWFWQRSNNNDRKNKETSSSLRLQYTRYGEGPPFYAPGRMCMLELQARPIDDLDEATPILQDLIQHRVRGWGNSGDDGGASLQLLSNDDIDFGATTTTQWAKRRQGQALALWERLRAATTVQQESSSTTGTMGGVLED
jgi:hypothetical protein